MEKKTYCLIGGGGDGADLYGGLMMEVPKMDPLGLLLHHHHHYHLDAAAAAANGNASPPSIPPRNKQSLPHFRFRLPTLSLFPQLDLPPLHVSNQPLSSPAPPFPSFSYFMISIHSRDWIFFLLFYVFSQEFFRTREVGEFASGALAGAMTKAVLAPLETIRFHSPIPFPFSVSAIVSFIT